MELLDNTLLLQISKYCNIKSLNNISRVNKQFSGLRLYRLYYGEIFKKRFGLECIRDVKVYLNMYHLNDYLKDLIYSLGYPRYNIYSYNRKIQHYMGYSSDWFMVTNYNFEKTKKYWKNKQYLNTKKLYKIQLCMTYRISSLRKRLYKRENGNNLLALIY